MKKNASLLEIFYFVNVFLKIKIKISVEIVSLKKNTPLTHTQTHSYRSEIENGKYI